MKPLPLSPLLAEIHIHPLPIWDTLRSYRSETFKKDLRSGLTVAALTLPQAMAFAMVAGLPPQYGLYGAILGGLFCAIFGSSNQVMFGPTNATALVVASALLQFGSQVNPLTAVLTITFLVGVFHLIGGLGKFGTLTQYISRSVVIGYMAGAAILIISNQIHTLLGFGIGRTQHFYQLWGETLHGLAETNFLNLGIGCFGIAFILVLKRRRPAFPAVLAYIIISSVAVYLFNEFGDEPLDLQVIGAIPASLPPFHPLRINFDSFRLMMSPALAIALLSMLEATAIAKTLAASSGQRLNTNQELVGLGAGNIASALFGGMPVSGSLTRSTLNHQSGAKTRISAMICSLSVALVIWLAGPLARYIPTVCLAAVLIVVASQAVSRRLIRISVRSTRSDAAVFVCTLAATLTMPLDIAIYFGVGLSLALFLHKASLPHLVEYSFSDEGSLKEIDSPQKRSHAQISIIHVEGELFFGAADLFQDQIRRISEDEDIKVIILRMKNARHLDATTVLSIDQLVDVLERDNRHLIVSGITADVSSVLKRSGLMDKIGIQNIFPAEANLNASTRNALKRALDLINADKADIRIFYDKTRDTGPAREQPIMYDI